MKANLLYRFGNAGWCRHGLVLTWDDGRGLYAADTYWRTGYPSGSVSIADLESSGEFIADLDEFRASNEKEYARYADKDRVWIPIGGSSERYLVRKDATPDMDNCIAQINMEIEDWKAKERSAQWNITELTKELAAVTAQRD